MKQTIQAYLDNADIESAIFELREYAKTQQNNDLINDLILLSARLSVVERKEYQRTDSSENIGIERNRILAALLPICETLPNNPTDKTGKVQLLLLGITEKSMKQQLFFLLLGAKISIFLWLFFHYSTNGINSIEFAGAFGLLLPVFASYLGLMFQDFLEQRHSLPSRKSPRIKSSVQWTIYAILFAYTFALFFVVYLRTARGTVALVTGFTLIETLFGAYLSRIIATFFGRS